MKVNSINNTDIASFVVFNERCFENINLLPINIEKTIEKIKFEFNKTTKSSCSILRKHRKITWTPTFLTVSHSISLVCWCYGFYKSNTTTKLIYSIAAWLLFAIDTFDFLKDTRLKKLLVAYIIVASSSYFLWKGLGQEIKKLLSKFVFKACITGLDQNNLELFKSCYKKYDNINILCRDDEHSILNHLFVNFILLVCRVFANHVYPKMLFKKSESYWQKKISKAANKTLKNENDFTKIADVYKKETLENNFFKKMKNYDHNAFLSDYTNEKEAFFKKYDNTLILMEQQIRLFRFFHTIKLMQGEVNIEYLDGIINYLRRFDKYEKFLKESKVFSQSNTYPLRKNKNEMFTLFIKYKSTLDKNSTYFFDDRDPNVIWLKNFKISKHLKNPSIVTNIFEKNLMYFSIPIIKGDIKINEANKNLKKRIEDIIRYDILEFTEFDPIDTIEAQIKLLEKIFET